MTRLFNLDSYPELCSFALLFEQEIKKLLPKSENFAASYKKLLENYSKKSYLFEPQCESELTYKKKLSFVNCLGIKLAGENQALYVVPDKVDLLTLKKFFKSTETYLYKSAYYYWNYFDYVTSCVDPNIAKKSSQLILRYWFKKKFVINRLK